MRHIATSIRAGACILGVAVYAATLPAGAGIATMASVAVVAIAWRVVDAAFTPLVQPERSTA